MGDILMKSNLVVMVGPPGCGKTTFIKNQPLKGNHISRDKIRFSLLEDGETYFGKEDLVFKEYVKQIQESLDAGCRTYADATHLNEKSRNKLLDNLNLENVDIYMVVFDTSLKDCLERNSHREGKERVPESALKRMYLSKTNPKGDQKYRYKEVYEVR